MTSAVSETPTRSSWPLARTFEGRIFLGVLAGLARWIGTTPLTLRVIFIIGMFAAPGWSATAAYFAAALLMPVANPSADHLVGLRTRFNGWTVVVFLVGALRTLRLIDDAFAVA